ncbi:MAG: hypothetical protein QNJ61_11885 [Desulfobacterales bacterium]|nr:hypothetical protein [Desulfobacterales bacterium]
MADISNVCFQKAEREISRDVTIDSDMLKVLMALDGKKTVREVSVEVDMARGLFKSTFLKLYKLGLVEKVGQDLACVTPAFIEQMREALIQLIGPLGSVLVDDAADAMGWVVSRIPLARVADFVVAVAREIPGDQQGNEFKKQMIEEIKTLGW